MSLANRGNLGTHLEDNCKHKHDCDETMIIKYEYNHGGKLRSLKSSVMHGARVVFPVNVACVYRASLHTTAASVLCVCSQLLLGDASRQRAPTETTSHIKGVPLAEYDYKLLSHESTSTPRQEKRRSGFSLKMTGPQRELSLHIFLFGRLFLGFFLSLNVHRFHYYRSLC